MDATLWSIIIPIVSVVVVGVGIFIANSSKYYTIREHASFENAIYRDLYASRETTRQHIEDLRDRIKVLEQTRPTTGELQAALRTGTVNHAKP